MNVLRIPALLMTLAILLITAVETNAQILDRIERKVKNRVNRKIDKTIDKGLDKAEKGVDDAARKEKNDQKMPGTTDSNSGENTDNKEATAVTTGVNTMFDFVPGENVLFEDDFVMDNIGDFPARWNTNGSGEVVTMNGHPGRWLKIPDNTISFPETGKVLPENFTIEFDLFYPAGSTRAPVTFGFSENRDPAKSGLRYKKLFYFRIDHFKNVIGSSNTLYSGKEENKSYPVSNKANKMIRASISVNKTRIRLYLDQDKVFDLPRAFEPTSLRNNFHFRAAEILPAAKQPFYVANLRIAAGETDLRSKLLSAGKVSTTGILFDVNAAKIKPQSYGIIREIALAMQENPDMRLKIIGHTDNDGSADANMQLSRRRAEAIKQALQEQHLIAAARIATEGKGASQPVADNTSAAGKSKNRRVEFVKVLQ